MLLATTPSFPLHACHFYIPQSVFHLYKSLFLLREKHLEKLQLVHHTKEFPNLLRKNQNQTDKKGMNIEIVLAETCCSLFDSSRHFIIKGKSDHAYIVDSGITCGIFDPSCSIDRTVSFAFRAVWFMEYELELYVKSYLCVPLGVSMICICVCLCVGLFWLLPTVVCGSEPRGALKWVKGQIHTHSH